MIYTAIVLLPMLGALVAGLFGLHYKRCLTLPGGSTAERP